MARAKAKLSQKRAGKKFPNAEYTPEKKKDRKRAREKRREKRKRSKEPKPKEEPRPKEEPKKEPEKPPQQREPEAHTTDFEEAPDEVEYLIDKIYELIDEIADKLIPNISDKVSAICRKAFASFCEEVSEDMNGLTSALRSILADPLLHYDHYDSDDIQQAKAFAEELNALASHLKSEQLNDFAKDLADFENITDEEWEDVPTSGDFMQFL